MIHNSSLQLLNLINQILEFRKTETQNRTLTVSRRDLGSFVTEIGLRYKELNRNEKVEFVIDVDKMTDDIYFDTDVITTVLNNLLSNAVKYTPRAVSRFLSRSGISMAWNMPRSRWPTRATA